MAQHLRSSHSVSSDNKIGHYRTHLLILVACLAVAGLVSVEGYTSSLDKTANELLLDTGPQASLVFDRTGQLVFSFASEERTDVEIDSLSPNVVAAVLAAEDRHFYRHVGLDLLRMGSAALRNARAGRIVQGGSTITQQLVRVLALTRERTYSRKWREALLALRIERRFSKSQILEAYLNRIYLGDGYFGIEAASRGYFGKTSSNLSTSEAALLAGLIKCPSSCSPRLEPQRALARRNIVLRAMAETGQLSMQEFGVAVDSPVRVEITRHNSFGSNQHEDPNRACALYFMEAVRRRVVDSLGEDPVLRGGLRIYTTLDMRLQKSAEDVIARRLAELDPDAKAAPNTSRLQAGLVAIDPHTGEVLALVGGRDFHQSPFNRATQAQRQAGSAFKPLLYAAALEHGYAPSSLISDLDTPIPGGAAPWLPSGEHEAGSYTLRQALRISSNRAAAHLMQLIGVSTTQAYARKLGISSPLPRVPSLALGTAEVSLLDLTSAYGAFANDGLVTPPVLIRRVEDRAGDVLLQENRGSYRALRSGTAYLMSSMLADVMNRGTGVAARAAGFKLPAAGKTGTTDDYSDAWFIGYTPRLLAGVWFGRDRRGPIMTKGFAATVAVPAWARFMSEATAGDAPEWFKPPRDVERVKVCSESRLKASEYCPSVYDDYFLVGTAPYETCLVHDSEFVSEPESDLESAGSVTQPLPLADVK